MAGCDGVVGVAEDVALRSSRVSTYALRLDCGGMEDAGLTAMMLQKPRMVMTTPLPRTMWWKAVPRASSCAGTFREPSMCRPRTIMAMPRVTKPWAGLRRGQLRAK